MTRESIEYIVKRFSFISNAINKKLNQAVFYIGNRKQVINITEEVERVCEIIEIIYTNENDSWVKKMIKNIKLGESDIFIMQDIHCSKNAYYAKKTAFIDKIYNCCISWNLVSFEEILMEQIA